MKGYNKTFLHEDISIALPEVSESMIGNLVRSEFLRDFIYLDYYHYTLVMNKLTRQLLFAASNIDQKKIKKTERASWNTDSRIPSDSQLNLEHYRNNPWDRGHMVRRDINSWGDTARDAQLGSNATMFYTNAAFQHENFNQDEWKELEEMFKNFQEDKNDKLTVFTGPIHTEFDRSYSRSWHETVRIPSGFFKVICFINKKGKLESRAFVMYQDEEALRDKKGKKRGFNFRNHQITLTELEELTSLEFDSILYNTNPLFYNPNASVSDKVDHFPERIVIEDADDLVSDSQTKRRKRMLPEEKQDVKFLAALVNPKGEELSQEWLSLINETTSTVKLKGWKMKDKKGRVINFTDEEIESGNILKIQLKDYRNAIILGNKGNRLSLLNEEGEIVDAASYSAKKVRSVGEGRILRF